MSRYCLVALFSATFFSTTLIAQRDDFVTVPSDGNECEVNNMLIDRLISEAQKSEIQIFFIARRAKEERRSIDVSRLSYAAAIIKVKGFSSQGRITPAVGPESEVRFGNIELWLGGKLLFVSHAKKNKQVCLQVRDSSK